MGLLIFLLDVPVLDRFRLAALLYLAFAIPIFLVVRERRAANAAPLRVADVLASLGQLRLSIAHAREVPGLGRFLVGRFFYSDAVNTVIVVMSVVTTEALLVSDATANVILLGLTVVAIAMSFVWGWLADRIGPKRTLVIVLWSWAVGLVLGGISLGFGADGLVPFLIAGAILGSGLGGVTVADRVLMIRLSPPERVGEFFGLYGLVGKGSQVVGQLLYGLTIFLFLDTLGVGAYQIAVLSLLVTMLIGLWLMWPVRDDWAGSGEVAGRARDSRHPCDSRRRRRRWSAATNAPQAPRRPASGSGRGAACRSRSARTVARRRSRRRPPWGLPSADRPGWRQGPGPERPSRGCTKHWAPLALARSVDDRRMRTMGASLLPRRMPSISHRTRQDAPGARPTRSRPCPRASATPRPSPGPSRHDPTAATRVGGSPARRGPIVTGISRPTTADAAARTSRLLNPPPIPRLQAMAPSAVRASSAAVASMASRWAEARSLTWM